MAIGLHDQDLAEPAQNADDDEEQHASCALGMVQPNMLVLRPWARR